jgi:superfamily II DNA/RNA helicase
VDVCEEYQKEAKLARLLEEIGCQQGSKIIIFVETKRKADELTRCLLNL